MHFMSSFPAMAIALISIPMGYGVPPAFAEDWMDDFESYQVGSFPSPSWTNSGNTAVWVDNAHAVSGSQSLRLYGIVGGCWGALAHREYSSSSPMKIQFYVLNGSETLSGCHTIYGRSGLNTYASWASPHRALVDFDVDDRTGEKIIRANVGGDDPVYGDSLGAFESEVWYKVTIKYENVGADSVALTYWIDDDFRGEYRRQAFPFEADLRILSIASDEGTTWFDDVRVEHWPQSTILDGELDAGLLCLTWSSVPSAAGYWIYGSSDSPYFMPSLGPPYEYRIRTLPPESTTWSTAQGIGSLLEDWTYLVLAVDASESELCRSNRIGEHDFETVVP